MYYRYNNLIPLHNIPNLPKAQFLRFSLLTFATIHKAGFLDWSCPIMFLQIFYFQ